jgi:hypothetical protein
VKLIRELREEIEKLRSMVSQNDPVTARKLAVKEAQERHLTEEWTEKWKEAANILKEQQALALKRTGQGVMLDSEKPHLVKICYFVPNFIKSQSSIDTLNFSITTLYMGSLCRQTLSQIINIKMIDRLFFA